MKFSDLKPRGQAAGESGADPVRVERNRPALAREVANHVLRYRVQQGMSQRQLAALAGMAQPQIARLEKAEHQPSFDTLARLTRATGLEFLFQVSHGGVELISA